MISHSERRKAAQEHLAKQRLLGEQLLRSQPAANYCTRHVDNLSPGAGCPSCGHTTLVHPWAGNPAVDHCGLCELDALLADLRG